jgi:hypothetical protein
MAGEGFGQPQIVGHQEFNVTNLSVIEAGPAPGTMNIVDANEAFTLEFKFELKGGGWGFLNALHRASIQFRAESIGSGPEYYLGEECVALTPMPAAGEYTVTHNYAGGIPVSRVYRLSAVIVFESVTDPGDRTNCAAASTPVTGYLGFYEGALLQVHSFEQ